MRDTEHHVLARSFARAISLSYRGTGRLGGAREGECRGGQSDGEVGEEGRGLGNGAWGWGEGLSGEADTCPYPTSSHPLISSVCSSTVTEQLVARGFNPPFSVFSP